MTRLIALSVWSLLAAGVIYLGFGPEVGVVQTGPWAAIGLGLLGVAICQHVHTDPTSD